MVKEIKLKKVKFPNELIVQLQARFNKANIDECWNSLSKEEKIKEIEWCFARCYVDYEENPERRLYLCNQRKMLIKLRDYLIK